MKNIPKKIFAVFVLAIFMLSIAPLALAEEDVDKSERELRADRVDFGKMKDRLQRAHEKFNIAKEKHLEARERFAAHKEKVTELAQRIRDCKADDDCEITDEEKFTSAREHFINIIDVLDRNLEKFVSRVAESEKLSEERQESLLAEIESLQDSLAEQKEVVESAETLEDLTGIRAALKDIQKEKNLLARHLTSMFTTHKVGKVGVSLEKIADSMQKRIDVKAEEGFDVAELEALHAELLEIKVHVDAAAELSAEKLAEAQDAENREEYKEIYSEVREIRADAQKSLKEAKAVIREFVAAFKELQ